MKIVSNPYLLIGVALAAVFLVSSRTSAQKPPTVLTGAGDVVPVVDAYRKLLGDPNNAATAASQKTGRREINWDGVPDDKAAPAFLPGDFFKARGAKLSTPGMGVQVSAAPGNYARVAPRFGHINPTYEKIFKAFS